MDEEQRNDLLPLLEATDGSNSYSASTRRKPVASTDSALVKKGQTRTKLDKDQIPSYSPFQGFNSVVSRLLKSYVPSSMAVPGPYSGVSTLAFVARASAFTLGFVYGSIKFSYLKAKAKSHKKAEAKGHQ